MAFAFAGLHRVCAPMLDNLARGNPLALLELPRGMSAADFDLGSGSHDSTTMASRIEQGFVGQLEHVPDDTRRLLLAAAVEPLGDVTLLWRAADHLGIPRWSHD